MGRLKSGVWLLWAALLASACERESVFAGPDGSDPFGQLDGGFIRPDTGPLPDAGVTDLGVDAGVEEECTCPALPSTCTLGAADTPAFSPGPAILEQLFSELACADTVVRAAIYEIDWDCIVDALVARLDANPNLTVELVIDDDRCPRVNGTLACELSRLDGNPRVTIVDDQRSKYMHHKFVIVDDDRVWAGSANLTKRSFCTDHNNSVVIDAPGILDAYLFEFRRMFDQKEFGPTPPRPVARDGRYGLYFSPESPVDAPSAWFDQLVRAVETASVSVDVMTASWTRTEVSDAILSARARGVRVRSLVLSSYVNDAPTQALIAAGVDVRHGTVHDKVAIIDGHLVVTGSPNWSQNSWGNNEGSLWIDDPVIGAVYSAEMDRVFSTFSLP